MIPGIPAPVVTHLWQSTIFAGLVWLAAVALRHNRARVRYWLWVAASLKFLVPFSWLIMLGAQFEWRTVPASAQPAAAFVIEQVLAPAVVNPASTQGVSPSSFIPWFAPAVWLVGVATMCVWWWRQWLPVRASLRAATRLPVDSSDELSGLAVMSSPTTMEPGVVGVWRPVLLVPDGLLDQLTAAQVDALIAHERSHVRHRDNLMAAIHMAVEALFWFHPLVWWIEGRMIDERERACDEDVLLSGSRPSDYAEGILAVCRLSVRARLACVAGVTGSDLRRRIETILRGGMSRPMSAGPRCALALAAIASIGLPIVAGAMHAVPLVTVGQDPSSPVAFDVASVKANRSGERAARLEEPPGGLFTASNVPLRLLITYAYQISDNQLVSAPEWSRTERFDITARLDHEPPAVPRSEPGERRLALRTLLAERFNLAVKREMREVPMYALVMARDDRRLGPMLTPSSTDCTPEGMRARIAGAQAGKPASGMCGSRFNAGRIQFGGIPLSEFVKVFSPYDGRSVIDRTGLTGNWDGNLTFTPDQAGPPLPGQDAPVIDPNLPSLPTALQEQLGLKLESTKGLVEVLVVERVERPTAN